MTDDQQLTRLERRLTLLEDRLEIYDLIASYGPLVDAGDADATAALWTEQGVYDVDTGRYEGRDGIAEMVRSHPHQRLIEHGCAHLTTLPRISIHGDTATAVCHSQLVVRRGDGSGFDLLRATAHRWHLVRSPDGWRVELRTSRLLDGSAAARALLGGDVGAPGAAASDTQHDRRG